MFKKNKILKPEISFPDILFFYKNKFFGICQWKYLTEFINVLICTYQEKYLRIFYFFKMLFSEGLARPLEFLPPKIFIKIPSTKIVGINETICRKYQKIMKLARYLMWPKMTNSKFMYLHTYVRTSRTICT